ncbi:MAG: ABC-F family ATP-binding cassette domain-containing protein [Lachnospiraceae bacterium]|jgi:ATP-binding cassette subfamily F protein 3|nr:ABC-F family ATP-binding cassette domain-containing protein [Lachnospiraceae bacterium]
MLLSCQNINKSFGEKDILRAVSFHVEEYDKMAIVGINGAGKTTLLRIIVGELPADEGQVILAKERTIGYLSQIEAVDGQNTIYEELLAVKAGLIRLEEQLRTTEHQMKDADEVALEQLLSTYTRLTHEFEMAGGYTYRSELVGVLKGLGFTETEFNKPVDTLSGGQKTRVALGKLLLEKPALIILDEPTNHLDMASVSWLETYLINYQGAVIIVSHDRYFLDRIAGKVVELDQGRATVFTGNYTAYAEKKELLRSADRKAYQNQQQEIRHQEEVIAKLRSFNREKSIKRAESREKMLNKIEVLERPTEQNSEIALRLNPATTSGNDVLAVDHLSKAFGPLNLFNDVNFEIKRGEHVAIIGDNGTGKTSLLKILNNDLSADSGSFTLGAKVCIGYYDQEHNVLDVTKTLFSELSDAYPTLNNTAIRNTLAAFLFTGDDVFKSIGMLSGGERGRVALAKLMLSEANFLILDEPTNHLDILSREILEDALNRYTGTVLYVSHDRYFINRTASRILELSGRQFYNYLGDYDYYQEKRNVVTGQLAETDQHWSGHHPSSGPDSTAPSAYPANTPSAPANASATSSAVMPGGTAAKTEYQSRKEQQALARKQENLIKRLEQQIEELEQQLAAIDTAMALPENATNAAELIKLNQQQTELSSSLTGLYEQWEAAADS